MKSLRVPRSGLAAPSRRLRPRALLPMLLCSWALACGEDGGSGGSTPAADSYWATSEEMARLFSSDPVDCSDCSLSLPLRTTFAGKRDSLLLIKFPLIAVDSRGVIYAVPRQAHGHQILVYAADGGFLRVLGGAGQGPGEYSAINSLAIGPGDSVYVAHDGNRLTVFDSGGAVARMRVLPVFMPMFLNPFPDGSLLAVSRLTAPQGAGLPAHYIGVDSTVRRSMGSENRSYPFTGPIMRQAGRAPDGSMWMSEYRMLRFEHVDTTGRLLDVFGLQDSAFGSVLFTSEQVRAAQEGIRNLVRSGRLKDVTDELLARPERLIMAPSPEVGGLFANARHLVILLHVAAPNWRELEVTYDGSQQEVVEAEHMLPVKYRSVLLVLRTDTKEVIVRRTLEGYWTAPQPGILAQLEYTGDGYVRGHIHELILRDRGQPSRFDGYQ